MATRMDYGVEREEYAYERELPMTRGEQRLAGKGDRAEDTGMGDSRTLTTQSKQTVALAQGTPLTEGWMYTAAFGVIPPTDADGNLLPFAAVVTVRYRENGNSVQRIFSLVQGRSITLPGRIIEVRVTDSTPATLPITGGATPGAGSEYTVFMTLERTVRAPTGEPLTLYAGTFAVAALGDVAFPIPQAAGAVSAQIAIGPGTELAADIPSSVSVRFTGPGGAGVFKAYVLSGSAAPTFVSIPPGATEIVVTNLDAAHAAIVSCEWGIDG